MDDLAKNLAKLFSGLSTRFAKIGNIYRRIPAPVKGVLKASGIQIAVQALFGFLDSTEEEIAKSVKKIEANLKDVEGRVIGARQDVANLSAQQMAIAETMTGDPNLRDKVEPLAGIGRDEENLKAAKVFQRGVLADEESRLLALRSAAIPDEIRITRAEENIERLKGVIAEIERQLGIDQGLRATVLTTVAPSEALAESALIPVTAATDPLTEMCATFEEKMAELTAAIDRFAETAAASLSGVSEAMDSTENQALAAAVEVANTATDEVGRTVETIDAQMEQSFGNLSRSGLGLTQDLKQMFGSLTDDLLASLGPLGGILSQLFGGGRGILSVLGLAGGGAVQPGLPVLVGERGPELLIPASPGRIMNSQGTRQALAGGPRVTIQQTNNFTTDVANSVRAEILNAAPAIAGAASQQVMDALRGIRR